MITTNYGNVFITGGAGFIGSHLADRLLSVSKRVTVFDNLSTGNKSFLKHCLPQKKFVFYKGDLLSASQLAKVLSPDVDIVIHAAANPDIAKGFKDPSFDLQQTTVATFNLLQEMRKKRIGRLVYLSGSGVYGDRGNTPITEGSGPFLPISMYGAVKLSAEGMISAYSNLYNIQSIILRPANIIGGRATHGVVLDFIRKLKNNPHLLSILGDGKQSKSYLHVTDLIEAVCLVFKKAKNNTSVYNVSSSTHTTVNRIATLVIEGMGLTDVTITHTTGKIGWPGDIPIVRLNSSALVKLGWKEKYTSEEAVKKTIQEILDEI